MQSCRVAWILSFVIVPNKSLTQIPLHSGPVDGDLVPNGDGEMDRPGGAGDGHLNGPLPLSASPQSTSTPVPVPVKSLSQESSLPGVAAFPPMMLEKSEEASAEGTVHKGDALLSLRISMPMQETELCKHKKPDL